MSKFAVIFSQVTGCFYTSFLVATITEQTSVCHRLAERLNPESTRDKVGRHSSDKETVNTLMVIVTGTVEYISVESNLQPEQDNLHLSEFLHAITPIILEVPDLLKVEKSEGITTFIEDSPSLLSHRNSEKRTQLNACTQMSNAEFSWPVFVSPNAQDAQQMHLCHALAGVTNAWVKTQTHARKCKRRILHARQMLMNHGGSGQLQDELQVAKARMERHTPVSQHGLGWLQAEPWKERASHEHLDRFESVQVQNNVEETHQEPPPHDVGDAGPIPPVFPHRMRRGSFDTHDAETGTIPAEIEPEMAQSAGKTSG
ncbi:hypothetical protein ARMGADRAFT_1104575 [Armillaria gallica]|uniref:Uncharacterized protein n=1 Tax=Armillaria gallica TaxID=47427 RepID=A0A2H3CJA7_ARMGA|nr:hypothetical protein ARMGADRAFT_1104575 [Armillaria gallica]